MSLFLGGRAGCGFRELMDCWCIPAAGFFCDLRRKGTPAASPDRRMFLSAGGSPKPHLAVDPGALPGNGSFPDPEFTAPELLSGSLSAPSPETDCYTLAVFLFAAMFGCLPYDGRELLGVPCVTSDVMLSFCRNTGRFVFSGGSNSIDAPQPWSGSGRLPSSGTGRIRSPARLLDCGSCRASGELKKGLKPSGSALCPDGN